MSNEYVKIKLIGKGTFGKAILVRRKSDDKLFVRKQISTREMNDKEREGATNEVNILKLLRHPYIIAYVDCYECKGSLNIMLEYAENGDLHNFIKHQKTPVSEKIILRWFVQLCMALKHVHSNNILHRDLKTSNIFLTNVGDNILGSKIQLADFGISKIMNSDTEMAKTVIGTPYYLSPEICEDKPYNTKSDVWALGCVLYELLTRRHAFNGKNLPALIMKILRGRYPPVPSLYSKKLRNLVSSMLRKNPKLRPSVDEILGLGYIRREMEWLIQEEIEKHPKLPEMCFSSPMKKSPSRGNVKRMRGRKPKVRKTESYNQVSKNLLKKARKKRKKKRPVQKKQPIISNMNYGYDKENIPAYDKKRQLKSVKSSDAVSSQKKRSKKEKPKRIISNPFQEVLVDTPEEIKSPTPNLVVLPTPQTPPSPTNNSPFPEPSNFKPVPTEHPSNSKASKNQKKTKKKKSVDTAWFKDKNSELDSIFGQLHPTQQVGLKTVEKARIKKDRKDMFSKRRRERKEELNSQISSSKSSPRSQDGYSPVSAPPIFGGGQDRDRDRDGHVPPYHKPFPHSSDGVGRVVSSSSSVPQSNHREQIMKHFGCFEEEHKKKKQISKKRHRKNKKKKVKDEQQKKMREHKRRLNDIKKRKQKSNLAKFIRQKRKNLGHPKDEGGHDDVAVSAPPNKPPPVVDDVGFISHDVEEEEEEEVVERSNPSQPLPLPLPSQAIPKKVSNVSEQQNNKESLKEFIRKERMKNRKKRIQQKNQKRREHSHISKNISKNKIGMARGRRKTPQFQFVSLSTRDSSSEEDEQVRNVKKKKKMSVRGRGRGKRGKKSVHGQRKKSKAVNIFIIGEKEKEEKGEEIGDEIEEERDDIATSEISESSEDEESENEGEGEEEEEEETSDENDQYEEEETRKFVDGAFKIVSAPLTQEQEEEEVKPNLPRLESVEDQSIEEQQQKLSIRIELLRTTIENMIGMENFLRVYKITRQIIEADFDDDELENRLQAELEELCENHSEIRLNMRKIKHLIYCEDSLYGRNNIVI